MIYRDLHDDISAVCLGMEGSLCFHTRKKEEEGRRKKKGEPREMKLRQGSSN
jgi:hypothetical protein